MEGSKPDNKSSMDTSVGRDIGIGSTINDRFALLEILGTGAGGTVYKARHLLLDQFVAVKIINNELVEKEEARIRFQREASLLNSLEHPNIVRLLAFGVLPDQQLYMVLEFIQGVSLSKKLETSKTLGAEKALSIFIDITKGLEYAHSHGIVHRDIKPANIMIVPHENAASGQEKAVILDFGIFRDLTGGNQSLTGTGKIFGTADYMSPEQCKTAKVDARSDIYSMGCLMYETLTGTAPMHGDSELAIMSNHLSKPVSSVPAPGGISAELESVVLKCLQKDPDLRFLSSSELLSKLNECVGLPPLSNPSKSVPGASKPPLMGLAIAAFASIGLIALFLLVKPQSKQPSDSLQVTDPVESKPKPLRSLHPPKRGLELSLVKERDIWIQKHLNDGRVKPILLSNQYVDSYMSHALFEMPGTPPGAKEIRQRLETAYDSRAKLEDSERYELLHDLALLSYFAKDSGEDPSIDVDKYLAELSRKGSDPLTENARYANLKSVHQKLSQMAFLRKEAAIALKYLLMEEQNIPNKKSSEMLENLHSQASAYRALQDKTRQHALILRAADCLETLLKSGRSVGYPLCESTFTHLNQTGESKRVVSISKLMPELNNKAGTNPDFSGMRLELSQAYANLGDEGKAESFLRGDLTQFQKSSDVDRALPALLRLLRDLHRREKDGLLVEQARSFLKKVKDRYPNKYLGTWYPICETVHSFRIMPMPLWPEIRQGVDLFSKSHPIESANTLVRAAAAFNGEGQHKQAVAVYDEAIGLLKNLPEQTDLLETALCGRFLAIVLQNNQAVSESEYRALSSRELTRKGRFIADLTYAELLDHHGKKSEAAVMLKDLLANADADPIPDNTHYATCAQALAAIYLSRKENERAYLLVEHSIEKVKELERNRHQLRALYKLQAAICRTMKRDSEAQVFDGLAEGVQRKG